MPVLKHHTFGLDLRFSIAVGERLNEVNCPSLFMYGDHDPIVKASQGVAATSVDKNSRFVLLRESSHELALDIERELVAGKVLEFISQHI